MPQPLSDYFALEAGEYLDQLDAMLTRGEGVDASEFFRLARGVRGSAQIAGAAGIAGVAERLEEAARSLREGRLTWSEEIRQRAIRTVDDIRVLMRSHGRWTAADDERAREAAAQWGEGARRDRGGDADADQLFAFVRREITGVVAEMDRVRGELAEAPSAREPLRAVLRRMRPVRGVAGLASLAPVLEVLEGIEELSQEVLSRATSVEAAHLALLAAARDALEAAGESLERGEAPGVTPALQRFREARDRDGGADAAVVSVATLFHDDAGPHLVSSPLAPVPHADGAGGTHEVESFFRIEATGFLDRAEGVIGESQPGGFPRTARQLAELAESVGDMAATYGMSDIAQAAAEAAVRLRGAGGPDAAGEVLAALHEAIPGVLPRARREAPTPAADGDASTEAVTEPASTEAAPSAGGWIDVAADEDGVVPIETLLYTPADALREALALRPRLEALLGADAGTRELVDELFALVALGADAPARAS